MIPPHWPKPANGKLEKVYSALYDAGATFGGGQDWSCPAHEDERASLGVTAGDTQPVIFKCQAGCTTPEILKALGLKPKNISNSVKGASTGSSANQTKKFVDEQKWIYTDEVGHPLIFVKRMNYSDGSKDYRQGNAVTGKVTSVKGIRNTLYNFPAVIRTVAAKGVVWLVEGEKSADALNDVLPPGEVATTQRMGASQPWPDDFTDELRGAGAVRIVADFDKAGFSRALAVGGALHSAKIPVTVWRGAVERKGADIVDHLVAMKTESDLIRLTARDIKTQLQIWESLQDTPDEGEDEDDDVWPGANTPFSVAQEYVERFHHHPDSTTLAFWREDFYEWLAAENRYKSIEDQELRRRFYRTLDRAVTQGANGISPWTPTREKLNRVLDALQAESHVSAELERSWRESREVARVIPFANGNLDIASKVLSAPTPNLFTTVALPYAYDALATSPVRWLKFLDELWPGDADSKAVLQEWFGYILSGSVNLHSMLAIVGPRRSGKSTIAAILKRLVGEANTTSPTLQSMLTSFGLQSWLNKTLAVIEDARFNPKNTEQVTELLLRISSGNAVEIDRKYKDPLSITLPTRIMYVSNEFPNIVDHSGALFSRFIFLRTQRSFLDIEDRQLLDKLTEELPGILVWALEGMDRLMEREHFTTVKSMVDVNRDIEEMQSPIKQFMRESCKRGGFTPTNNLYEAYELWADRNGIKYIPPASVFSRNLMAAYPDIPRVQRRVGDRKENRRERGYPVTLKKRQIQV